MSQQPGYGYGQQSPQFQQPPANGWGNPPQQQNYRPPAQPRNGNDVLMGGGAGSAAWTFPAPGTHKVAKITKPPTSRQETEYDPQHPGQGKGKFFPSGDPIMSVLVEVQTDERNYDDPEDEGKRTFYIEGKRLKDAVRDAVRDAGAPGLEVGGVLDVTLTHYDVEGDRKSGRNWQVIYTSAANAGLMGGSARQQTFSPSAAYANYQQQQQWSDPSQTATATAPTTSSDAAAAYDTWQSQGNGGY